MKKQFKIDHSIAIEMDGIYIDLHNFYSFEGFIIDIPKNEVKLEWTKLEKWDGEQGDKYVCMVFENVSFFNMSDNFFKVHPKSLEEIGYKEYHDFDYDWLNNEEQSKENYHIFFRFEGDEYLRVYSETITLNF